jgi:plastocyanin
VLKTLGAGVAGGTLLTGSASAQGGKGGGNSYGNGNAIGAFLNEEAMFKESPVWDTGVADRTGQEEVDVLFGGLTSIDLPFPDAPDMGPWGMDPRAVEVSPGTDVTWTWYDGPGAIDAHHLVSFFDPPYEEEFEMPWESDGHGHEHPGGDEEFYVHEALGDTFTYTFDEVGIYLYFCIPHGTPFSFEFGELGEVNNLFGQRGAVIVSDE